MTLEVMFFTFAISCAAFGMFLEIEFVEHTVNVHRTILQGDVKWLQKHKELLLSDSTV